VNIHTGFIQSPATAGIPEERVTKETQRTGGGDAETPPFKSCPICGHDPESNGYCRELTVRDYGQLMICVGPLITAATIILIGIFSDVSKRLRW
jgi:hypothetical protein